jgi:hypothetical protein
MTRNSEKAAPERPEQDQERETAPAPAEPCARRAMRNRGCDADLSVFNPANFLLADDPL